MAYNALVEVAQSRIADVNALADSFMKERDGAEAMGVEELREALEGDAELTLIDVRPANEYHAGHFPGAISVPVADLADRMSELPKDSPIIAYCRGPYCVMAATAVHQLREAGYQAARLEAGYHNMLLRGAGAP